MQQVRTPDSSDFYCDEALSGKTSIEVVQETEHVLAFKHTQPYWDLIHVVVIPKTHINSLLTVDREEQSILLEMISVIQQITAKVVKEHGACRILTNLGKYQDSKHLHFHVAAGNPIR